MDTTIDQTRISQLDAGTLLRTAKWARLIGIIGMVMAAIMALLSFFIGGFFVRMIAMQRRLLSEPGSGQAFDFDGLLAALEASR